MIDQAQLVNHLEEIRRRLVYILITFLLFGFAALAYANPIISYLRRAAKTGGEEMKLLVLGPGDVMHVYFLIAGVVAIICTLPFLIWHVWRFISPALGERERKMAVRYIPGILAMFVLGILFAWYIVFPMIFKFLMKLGSSQFDMMISASNYFGFMCSIILPLGLLFEMPVVVMLLTSLGLVKPASLVKIRKYAYFVLVIVATMISPPDYVSHLSVAIPLLLLYEVSVVASRFVYRRRLST